MALSRHNSNTGSSSGSSTVAATLSASIGEIIVVVVNNEDVSGAVKTVTGISDGTGNVYAKRFSATQTGASEPRFGASEGFEVWWAYAANALSTSTITATLSASTDDAVIIVAGYQGFTGTAYQTAPWDTDASLPKTAQGTSGSTTATASGISTTSTAGILLAGAGTVSDASQFPPPPSGFSQAGSITNSGGSNSVQAALFDEVYASAQSSITVTVGTATSGWIFYVDALTVPAGGAAAQTPYNPWPLRAPILAQ